MVENLSKKLWVTLGFGLLWLFLFSIPVGRGRHLFDVAWFYIVDTGPVHWVINGIGGAFNATTNSAKQAADGLVNRMDDKVSQVEDKSKE